MLSALAHAYSTLVIIAPRRHAAGNVERDQAAAFDGVLFVPEKMPVAAPLLLGTFSNMVSPGRAHHGREVGLNGWRRE